MAENMIARRDRLVAKMNAEVSELERRGLRLAGNAFSPVLLLKGRPNAQELAGEAVCSQRDGVALRAALTALGYAPEDWCALLATDPAGHPVAVDDLRLAIAAFAPTTIVCCDEEAASSFREAYADELAELPDLNCAMLVPGVVSRVLGMRVLNLGGFEASLDDARQKQVMWAYLKRIPALGEPY